MELKSMVVNVGQAAAHINGHVDRKNPAGTRINLKANNAALPEVGKLLPALGIILPNNASFASGVLSQAGEFHGSLQPLNGQASLNVQNAKLSGYSIADKVASVARFAGINAGRDTEIQ